MDLFQENSNLIVKLSVGIKGEKRSRKEDYKKAPELDSKILELLGDKFVNIERVSKYRSKKREVTLSKKAEKLKIKPS